MRLLAMLKIRIKTIKLAYYFIWRNYVKRDNVVGYKWLRCPVCGNFTLDSFWVCPRCKWIYEDFCEEHPDEKSDSNGELSLNEYKALYKRMTSG